MDKLMELKRMVEEYSTAPTLGGMPRRTLVDKGINGATAAHVIEELHTPLNLAYVTFTTGSTAFQNIVGVTLEELPARQIATDRLLQMAGVKDGTTVLFTYAPLVNVFPASSLQQRGIVGQFLNCSSRDAFILALMEDRPDVVVGESSFIRASIVDAIRMGFKPPHGVTVLCAGTPLDMGLLDEATKYGWRVHDLYGCQEFGWLTLDGVPLRDDISLLPSPCGDSYREFVVGGLPTGDSFIVSEKGHVCNRDGKVITYNRKRTHPEYEVYVKATTLLSEESVHNVCRTILRIKSRIVKVANDIKTSAPSTELELISANGAVAIIGKTEMFDSLLKAQINYQQNAKTDGTWLKTR